MSTFAFEPTPIEQKPTNRTRFVNDEYRPIYDAVMALEDGHMLTVTFDSATTTRNAKGTVQALANQAGHTIREQRGSRVEHDDGTVTLSLVKRPKVKKSRGKHPRERDDALTT